MFRNYFKIAWRNLLKSRVTGFINIAGLAIGMAVVMMIALWIRDELSYDQYHKNYDRIAQVYINQTFNNETFTGMASSLPAAPALRDKLGSDFKRVARASWNFQHLLANGENGFLFDGMYAEPDLPDLLSVEYVYESAPNSIEKPNTILLNRSVAQALFGEEDPIGKVIRFDTRSNLEVAGVFEDIPFSSSFRTTEFLVNWDYYVDSNDWVKRSMENWSNHSFQLFTEIEEHADFASVSAKMRDFEKEHNPAPKPELFLFPMSKWHLYSEFEHGENIGGRIKYVWLFGIIGIFVLILACINFMNLSTARSVNRAKEVGIRKSIGSMRSQLIGQFLSESLIVTFLALAFAITLVQLFLSPFNELADKQLVIPWEYPLFWGLLVGFTFLTGLLAGSYPAFYLSSFEPLQAIKGNLRAGRKSALPRQILVTIQFTVSVALIIGTLVVFKQIQHAKNRPVGYEREGIIQFFHNEELDGKEEVLRAELLETGAVEEVAHSNGPITNIWSNQSGFDWEGKDPDRMVSFGVMGCSPEMGKTVNWQVLEGRDFSREYGADTSSIILNEAAVELIGIDDIMGKTIRFDDRPLQVVGIIRNMVMESPWEPIKPSVFIVSYSWISYMSVRLKVGVPVKDALADVQRVFEKLSPSTPFEFEFVDEKYGEKFEAEERVGELAWVFAFLAIFISCLGLFGLSAYVAEQRTKEIGIRKVLGATVTNLWVMQSRGFIGLVLLSCFIAIPLAWYFLEGWLSDYEYRIELGWGIFIGAAFLALIVTLVTVSYQSLKAAMASPIKSLRTE
ncbi:MAG: ABC transporter permease [Bacteroidota bacterium]